MSPDGRYVAYVQHEGENYSLWLRQTATTSNLQIVAPQPSVTLFGATFTPDGASIDYVRQAGGAATEIWRVPFLGGTPKLFVSNVDSPISWAPDGQHLAFIRTQVAPTFVSHLIVAASDGGQERTLAESDPSEPWISLFAPWRPSFAPAWSPDGRRIAIIAAGRELGHVIVVDGETGSPHKIGIPNSTFVGLSWLAPESLVVNQRLQMGSPSQLFRLPYPDGILSRLTNDPNDYVGASLSGDRSALVTARRDWRTDIWVGDAGGTTGTEVVRRTPVSVERVAWSGDRLLYGTVVGGRPAVLITTPGQDGSEELIDDAVTPGVAGDGRTIVFVSTSNNLDLWKADASGRRIAMLVPSVAASHVVVTPDDRSVLYLSLEGGTISIWTVSIDGGPPTKLIDGASSPSVSPDGSSLAFTDSRAGLGVCKLPGCTDRRNIGPVEFDAPLAWTPDGTGVAYADDGNVWIQPLAGGSRRQLTRFTDGRPIESFAWSRDGKRLALTRSTQTNDIVLFKGLK
jgi:Tol biopolymer transport system component